jgi:hypothetical protein
LSTQLRSKVLLFYLVYYFFGTQKTLATKKRIFTQGIIAGLIGGILFFLKFTLLTIPFAAIIYLAINRSIDNKKLVQYIIGQFLGFIIIVALFAFYFERSGALPHFFEAMQWLKGYSSGDGASATASGYIDTGHFKLYPMGLLSAFGFTSLCFLAIGLVELLRKRSTLPSIYTHFSLQALIGFFAIMYEGKSYAYHFIRLLFAIAPLIALGLLSIFKILTTTVKSWMVLPFTSRFPRYVVLMLIILLAFFYSPFYRILNDPLKFVSLRLRGIDVGPAVHDRVKEYYEYSYHDQEKVTDALAPLIGLSGIILSSESTSDNHLSYKPVVWITEQHSRRFTIECSSIS